jgi:hypothetical protein
MQSNPSCNAKSTLAAAGKWATWFGIRSEIQHSRPCGKRIASRDPGMSRCRMEFFLADPIGLLPAVASIVLLAAD